MLKFEELALFLKQELQEGKYKTGNQFPSVYDLARDYNVNKSTANKAIILLLNEGYLSRAGSTRAGMVVRTGTPFPTGKIAYIGTFGHSFFSRIAEGCFHSAYENNYMIMPFSPPPQNMDLHLRKLENAGFQGIVTCCYGLLQTSLPVVYVDTGREDFPGFHVESDNYRGGWKMAEMLFNAGHREIVYLGNNNCQDGFAPRLKGFLEAMIHAGFQDAKSRFFRKISTVEDSSLLNLSLILKKFPKTKVIATDSDDRVFQLLRIAPKQGIRIPKDILLTGYGNVKEVQEIHPCPTVDQHPYELGIHACEKLIAILEHGPESVPKLELIDIELCNEIR